jgi:hypothetical protein
MTDRFVQIEYMNELDARIESLEELCRRALLALDEDYFPQLRQDLRDALSITESD